VESRERRESEPTLGATDGSTITSVPADWLSLPTSPVVVKRPHVLIVSLLLEVFLVVNQGEQAIRTLNYIFFFLDAFS
jgi:hypothetical protein